MHHIFDRPAVASQTPPSNPGLYLVITPKQGAATVKALSFNGELKFFPYSDVSKGVGMEIGHLRAWAGGDILWSPPINIKID